MSLWLFKTDPDTYTWSDLCQVKKEIWDGVTNNLALKYLRSMKKDDSIFIYHSGIERAIVGIGKARSNPYPDPSQKNQKLVVIDLAPSKKLKRPVTLSEIKSNQKLKTWELVRLSRLSVMPTTQAEWDEVLHLSRT